MACLTADRRAELEEQLTRKEIQLTTLYTSLENFDGIQEYQFSSGEAMQKTKYRSLTEIQGIIDKVEAQISRIRRILGNDGLNNIILRRKGYYGIC